MHELFKIFSHTLLESARNLIPIVVIIIGFQLLVFQSMPEDALSITIGFGIVVLGVTFFLMGLDLGVFPLGENLSNAFLAKKSLFWFSAFGFMIGFSASIAEPAIIAVATQAQTITHGALDAFTLRLIIAVSVGSITAFGILRTLLGWNIRTIIIIGYAVVLLITYFAPRSIVGLAYDSGGVATNVATVPIIVAIGVGIASALQGRSVLKDGFGFVALAAITPMISIQLYGIIVLGSDFGLTSTEFALDNSPVKALEFSFLSVIEGIFETFLNILPIMATIVFFQYVIIGKHLSNALRVMTGFIFLIIGLYGFIIGIKLGLFPIGASIAAHLVAKNDPFYIYLFAFLIGFGTTMAEPALVAVIKQADRFAKVRFHVIMVRLLVALGVGLGILLGTYKIVHGYDIWGLLTMLYMIVVVLTFFAPLEMVAFAFDLGGVTTSEITVPIVTAFGVYLASHIEGRNVLLDGFGLIAFASVFPMITVLGYSIFTQFLTGVRQKNRQFET